MHLHSNFAPNVLIMIHLRVDEIRLEGMWNGAQHGPASYAFTRRGQGSVNRKCIALIVVILHATAGVFCSWHWLRNSFRDLHAIRLFFKLFCREIIFLDCTDSTILSCHFRILLEFSSRSMKKCSVWKIRRNVLIFCINVRWPGFDEY